MGYADHPPDAAKRNHRPAGTAFGSIRGSTASAIRCDSSEIRLCMEPPSGLMPALPNTVLGCFRPHVKQVGSGPRRIPRPFPRFEF